MSVSGTVPEQKTPIMTTYTAAFPISHNPVPKSTGIFPYSAYSTPSTPMTPTPAPITRGRKRKNKENVLPTPNSPKRAKLDWTDLEKVRMFFAFIKEELGWSYGETVYKTSVALAEHNKNHKTSINSLENRPELKYHATDNQIMSTMQHFFAGRGEYTPGRILSSWYLHPYGRVNRDSNLMFSMDVGYKDIGPVRPALSSFAIQIVTQKLVDEAEKAIRPDSGLHVTLSTKKRTTKQVKWTDLGATTFEQTQNIIRSYQPLTWNLIIRLVTRAPHQQDNIKAVRIRRPPDLIATGLISTLNFSRSSQAKLLPLTTALLYFGSQVSSDIFRYQCRMGILPSYSSTLRAMRALAEHEALATLAHGQNPDTVGMIRLDNVQNYLLQRDPAVGRENKLNIGLAATYYEVETTGLDISVFNLSKDHGNKDSDLRKTLGVKKFQDLLDHEHIERICVLQWISVLIQHVPQLAHLRTQLSFAYDHRVSKLKLEVKPTKIHPLASSSRNETILTEFKAALEDFFNQTGQTRESFKPRIFAVGGDGLTFEKMIQLKEYLQVHSNDMDAMRIMKPMLEWWHTEWTNLSRIFESYWGDPFVNDPATLGHSAAKIGRKKPPNLKKVDFYPSTDLAYLVLDVRILDCWRLYFQQENIFTYFEVLSETGALPDFEDLENAARQLYRRYTSLRAQQKAMEGIASSFPKGSEWASESLPAEENVRKQKTKKQAKQSDTQHFQGDQVLAKSIAFMRETMHAREMTLATAQGDPGRIWEMIKVMLFTFAGSTHSKYTQYLLEIITDLELECSPELRVALLRMTLVNLRGFEGRWAAGDFIQEYFNRLLEAVVQRKGVEYGDRFIRDTWSRNIHHIGRLKLEWLEGVGLKARSAKHTGAGKKPEVKILLEVYKEAELHSFRQGRTMDSEEFVDDFQRGILKLRNGKLQRWVKKTTRSYGLKKKADRAPSDHSTRATGSDLDDDANSSSDTESDIEGVDSGTVARQALRFTSFVDGELMVAGFGSDELAQCMVEETKDDESESEDEDGCTDEDATSIPH